MMLVGLLLALADPAVAGVAPPQPTIQQQFDAATAAYDAGKWADAVTAFSAIEAKLSHKNRRSLSVVQLRKGVALMYLLKFDEAVPLLETALHDLPDDDPSLTSDRYTGWITIGLIHELRFDYSAAVDSYRHAEGIAPDHGAEAIVGQARIQAFLDPPQAIANADRALALEMAKPKPDKNKLGLLHTIRGRSLLNDRQYAAAKLELLKAVSILGGLTTRVNMADLGARSDLAIASLLTGNDADAKKYLAYSGSGNLDDGFAGGADMTPPECGDETGLRPDDVAVVEFGISSDGTISYAHPVYVSRPGPSAAEFAKAASQWSWSPEKLAKIPSLFRLMTRIELRCSNAHRRPTIATLMDNDVRRWLSDRHIPSPRLTGVEAADIVTLRAELARLTAQASGDPLAQAPVLLAIGYNWVATDAERTAADVKLRDIVLAQNPPPMVRAATMMRAALDHVQNQGDPRRFREAEMQGPEQLLSDPGIAADAQALNAVRIRIADIYSQSRRNDRASPLIDAVIADPRLKEKDALRIGALIRRSSIALANGDIQTARTSYDATGLSDTQCALVDASPVIVKQAGGASDYPAEAIEWFISGWAVNEFDIAANGSTANIRTIAAYPPFVFGKPNEKILQRKRFQQSYRPQGGLGCSSEQSHQSFTVIH